MAIRGTRGAGIIAVIASSALFAGMAALVRLLSADYDGIFVSLGRFVVGAAVASATIAARGEGFAIRDPKDVVLRGIYGSVGMILYFVSIQLSGAGRGSVLNTTYPLFSILLGALFFGERLGRRGVYGAFVCFAGVALIFWDSSSPSLLGDGLGLLSGLVAGISIQYTKRARVNNGAELVYLSVCLSGILASFWTAPRALSLDLGSALILVASALLGYGGQILLTWGVKFMDASEAGIISFLKIPIAIVLGLFLGEGLSLRFAAGTLVVIAGLAIAEFARRPGRPSAKAEAGTELRAFFDSVAERWDELAVHPRDRVDRVLEAAGGLEGLSVLDVGSGSGVLIEPLLERVGPGGRVLALDLSPRMIEVSRRAHSAPNLDFAVADFCAWTGAAKHDLVVAYSCYPHFLDQEAFWDSARRNLAAGGRVLVAHIEGREAINALHAGGGESLSLALPPIAELSRLARARGFETEAAVDDEEFYILAARLR
jgi:drug/metabolite transporter (DMT)-like permease/2-polyprenyl-3-methyl-5-hydroxy-6-metoxy-1,4-benzoquinol methylase